MHQTNNCKGKIGKRVSDGSVEVQDDEYCGDNPSCGFQMEEHRKKFIANKIKEKSVVRKKYESKSIIDASNQLLRGG